MRAFTAILAIGAIFGTTLATPVAVGEVAVEQRDVDVDIEARQALIPGLPTLPPITLPANPADLVPVLTNTLSQVVTILGVIRAGLPLTSGLPPLPDLPALPGVPLPTPGPPVTPEALAALLAQLQSRLTIIQQIFTTLPLDANIDQLSNALNILGQIQAQIAPVITVIRSLVGSGSITLPVNLVSVEDITNILGALLIFLGTLLGIVPALGGGGFS